jgi:hypothetical protein
MNRNEHFDCEKKQKLRHNYSENCPRNKKVIFLTARQHPGETWSSYLMD